MTSGILKVMSSVSMATLTRPKLVLSQARSRIYSKPPKNRIGAGQSFFVMTVFTFAMLTPAAWILHHLPEYRGQRSRQTPKT
ncbi:cytochrome c oxidase subunit 8A, mitochondrial [Sphaeramia orbicularis]|uniref:cytochrome c oxidase subunit 8A, mitochondrial n=1 Tax=Sphaeramia orbicularis TaxID=375764 RepID=UPI0011810633|nr:cytochrome c oxidase subunit 8A, mitochondrial-like [Sphaeramia orbicularis]